MAKITNEEKLKAIQRYMNGNEGYQSLAKILGVDPKDFHYWINKYKYHGAEAFKKSYTKYSATFKLDVINYMKEQGTSVRETAAAFNLSSPSILLTWIKQVERHGVDALISKKKGRPSMKKEKQNKRKKQIPNEGSIEALQDELELLRMENAYLKKLNSLVQNKEKSPKRTKRKQSMN